MNHFAVNVTEKQQVRFCSVYLILLKIEYIDLMISMKRARRIFLLFMFVLANISSKAGLYENYVVEYLRCTIDTTVLDNNKDVLLSHISSKSKLSINELAYYHFWIDEYMETGYYEDLATFLVPKIKPVVSLDDLLTIVGKVSESSVKNSINKVDMCCNALYSLYSRRTSIYDKCIAEGSHPEKVKLRDVGEEYASRFDVLYVRAKIKEIYEENFSNACKEVSKKEKKLTEQRLPFFLEDTHNILLNTFFVNGVTLNDINVFIDLCNTKGFAYLHEKTETTREFSEGLAKLYNHWILENGDMNALPLIFL